MSRFIFERVAITPSFEGQTVDTHLELFLHVLPPPPRVVRLAASHRRERAELGDYWPRGRRPSMVDSIKKTSVRSRRTGHGVRGVGLQIKLSVNKITETLGDIVVVVEGSVRGCRGWEWGGVVHVTRRHSGCVSQTPGVTPGDVPVMFLWIFSAVIAACCQVNLLYYPPTAPHHHPPLQHHHLLLLLHSLLSLSVSQSQRREREIQSRVTRRQ